MFVIKNRHRSPTLLKDFDNTFEPVVARISLLAFFIRWVVAVLPNDHHSIHCELAPTEGQCIFDGWNEVQAMAFDSITPKIFFRELINVDGCNVNAGLLPSVSPCIAHCVTI